MNLLSYVIIITISMFKSLHISSKRYISSSISRRKVRNSLFYSTSSISSSSSSSPPPPPPPSSSSSSSSETCSLSVIESQIVESLENECQIKHGDSLLLSVSGGSDSMAMLHMLQSIKSQFNPPLDLNVIHFNHKFRSESDEEAIFVQEWCKQYNLKFYLCENNDNNPVQSSNSNSIQLWSRNWRQQECERIVSSSSSRPKIVTAHHFDDQIETILMRLLRGTHISNLEGMKPRTVIKSTNQNEESNANSSENSCVYLKPFLNLKKKSLQQYLETKSLSWHEDSSNIKNDYTRNKIRNNVLPLLRNVSSIGGMTGSDAALDRRLQHLAKQSKQVNLLIKKELLLWLQQLQLQSQSQSQLPCMKIWATNYLKNVNDNDNYDDKGVMVHAIEIPISYLESYVHHAPKTDTESKTEIEVETVTADISVISSSLSELAVDQLLHSCITAVCGTTMSTSGLMIAMEKLGVSTAIIDTTTSTTTTIDVTGGQVTRAGSVIRIASNLSPSLSISLSTAIIDVKNLKLAIVHPHYISINTTANVNERVQTIKNEGGSEDNFSILDISLFALQTLATSYPSTFSTPDTSNGTTPITLSLTLRHPLPGDRYLRSDGRRLRLVDHFRSEGVALHERKEQLVMVDEEGVVYGIAKKRIDVDREEGEKESGERIVLEMKEGAPPAAPVHRKMALQILRHIIMK